MIILGGIYGGIVTATEAAAVSVIYAAFVEAVVFRALTFGKFVLIAQRSAVLTSVIFVLLATGSAIAYFVTLSGLPDWILGVMKAIDAGPVMFLAIVNVILLIAGMFIDPGTAILVLIPALFPVAASLGIDPVHFGLVVCVTACTAMITPPFGLDLFVASSTLNKPVDTGHSRRRSIRRCKSCRSDPRDLCPRHRYVSAQPFVRQGLTSSGSACKACSASNIRTLGR